MFQTVEKHHGRVEVRTIRVFPVPEHRNGWSGVRQWCEVETQVTYRGKTTSGHSYAITSLSPEQASPQQLLALHRGHWQVEVWHWHKDTLLREDASTLHKGNTPHVVAAIRNFTLSFIKNNLKMKPKEGREFLFNNLEYIRNTIKI